MKIFSIFLGMIFGVTLLAIFLAGGYYLFKYIAGIFAMLEPQIEILAVTATVVAMLCSIIIAEGLKARSKNEYLAITAVEKAKIYEPLLSLVSEQVKKQKSDDVHEAVIELPMLEQLLALHGSAKVITAYNNLKRSAAKDEKFGDEAHDLLKNLLVEMRADIGRKDLSLNKNDVLDLLLKRD